MLLKYAGLSSARDGDGYNILHHASEIGRSKVLAWLLGLPEIDSDVLLRQLSSGSFGRGLTPFLLGDVATSSYYEARREALMEVFSRFQVPWRTVRGALEKDKLQERLLALKTACGELQGISNAAKEAGATKEELRGLFFYNYLVGGVEEGVGVVHWKRNRARFIFERLASPLFDILASGKATPFHRKLLKRLQPLAAVEASIKNGETLEDALVSSSKRVTDMLRTSLDAAQLSLRKIPGFTLPGKQLHKLPIGWDRVHLRNIHRKYVIILLSSFPSFVLFHLSRSPSAR